MLADQNRIFSLMPRFVKEAIEKEIEEVVIEELEKAQKTATERIMARRAELIAGVVLRMEKVISMETIKDNIIIKIQLTDETHGTKEQGKEA